MVHRLFDLYGDPPFDVFFREGPPRHQDLSQPGVAFPILRLHGFGKVVLLNHSVLNQELSQAVGAVEDGRVDGSLAAFAYADLSVAPGGGNRKLQALIPAAARGLIKELTFDALGATASYTTSVTVAGVDRQADEGALRAQYSLAAGLSVGTALQVKGDAGSPSRL